MPGSSAKSFSINNLNAKLETPLCFRVKPYRGRVGGFLAIAVFWEWDWMAFSILCLKREQEAWQEVYAVWIHLSRYVLHCVFFFRQRKTTFFVKTQRWSPRKSEPQQHQGLLLLSCVVLRVLDLLLHLYPQTGLEYFSFRGINLFENVMKSYECSLP